MLAIKKSFMEMIGGYDEHFEADGGGENLELSFRIWMCGGQKLMPPLFFDIFSTIFKMQKCIFYLSLNCICPVV